MKNGFAGYVYRRIVLLEYELPALPPFDQREIDEALVSGDVIRTPVSIHRDEGHVYWSHDYLAELGLALVAGRVACNYRKCGKTNVIGTVGTVMSGTGQFSDHKIATIALAAGRHYGMLDEHDLGGVSVFTLKEVPGKR